MEALYNQYNNEHDKDFPTEHFIPLITLDDFLNEKDSIKKATYGLTTIGIPEEFFSIFDPKRFGEVDIDFPLEHCFNEFQIEELIMMELEVSMGAYVSEAFSRHAFKL